MLLWVEHMMWAWCRLLAYMMQLIGLLGLTGFGVIGLATLANRLLEE